MPLFPERYPGLVQRLRVPNGILVVGDSVS
jgi:TATA-box binding protein (TBP) (component of TFIID and TFIIIB)